MFDNLSVTVMNRRGLLASFSVVLGSTAGCLDSLAYPTVLSVHETDDVPANATVLERSDDCLADQEHIQELLDESAATNETHTSRELPPRAEQPVRDAVAACRKDDSHSVYVQNGDQIVVIELVELE